MTQSFWVLGTDTGIGKTYFTSLLSLSFQAEFPNHKISKPVATGVHEIAGERINPDTEALRSASPSRQSLEEITPWMYPGELAPWTASQNSQKILSAQEIANYALNLSLKADLLIAEGIGGVYVPLNSAETFLDIVLLTRWPVFLVAGLRLGCINHTLMTIGVLEQAQVPLLGVVLNDFSGDVQEEVKQSSFNEIKSRYSDVILFPYIASFPMALNKISEVRERLKWSF